MQPKTISSGLTFAAKVVIPVLWAIGFAAGLYLWDESHAQEMKFIGVNIFLAVFYAPYFVNLKKVRLDKNSLYVSNFLLEVAIPLANVRDIEQGSRKDVCTVTVSFREPTAFGDQIDFLTYNTSVFGATPPVHPVVAELKRRTGIQDRPESNKTYYIQRADAICEDVKDQSVEGVIHALRSFDWESELRAFEKLGNARRVPPSLCLGTFDDAHFAHIMIKAPDDAAISYFRINEASLQSRRWFSRGPKRDEIDAEHVRFKTVEEIIRAYHAGDQQKILELLQ